jgi:transposase
MSKYTKQFKLQVIECYLQESAGCALVARQFGIDHSIVRQWVRRFQLRGADGLEKYSHYSAEFKLSVLQHIWLNRLSYQEIALL